MSNYGTGQNGRKMPRLLGFLVTVLLMLPVCTVQAGELPNIVCITCHANLPGKFGAPVKLWQGSIHADNGIVCHNCHGGDPRDAANAMSPARGFLGAPKERAIPAFCGRCHVGVYKDYLASAHGNALGKGGPTCVTCHGNHRVLKASLDLINEKSCSSCHDYERARILRESMQETERMILGIELRTTAFRQRGVNTEKLEKGLFAVRNRFHSLFHNVNVQMVRNATGQIRQELKLQEEILAGIDSSQRKRKLAGAAAVGGALLAALLFHLLKRSYD